MTSLVVAGILLVPFLLLACLAGILLEGR